jgi:hypothetical protein
MLVWSIAVYLVAAADDAPDGIGKRTLEKHLPDPAHRRISCADVDIAGTPDEVGDAFAGESNSRIEQQQFKKTALFWSQLPTRTSCDAVVGALLAEDDLRSF